MFLVLNLLAFSDRMKNYNFPENTPNKYLLMSRVLGKVWQAFHYYGTYYEVISICKY